MKSLSINKHDRGRMFYLQSLLAPQREEKETKVQGWVGWGGLEIKKRDFQLKTALMAKE